MWTAEKPHLEETLSDQVCIVGKNARHLLSCFGNVLFIYMYIYTYILTYYYYYFIFFQLRNKTTNATVFFPPYINRYI